MNEPVPGERMGLSDFRRCAEYGKQFTDEFCDDCRKIARLPGTNRLTFDTKGGIIIFVERIAVYPHM